MEEGAKQPETKMLQADGSYSFGFPPRGQEGCSATVSVSLQGLASSSTYDVHCLLKDQSAGMTAVVSLPGLQTKEGKQQAGEHEYV